MEVKSAFPLLLVETRTIDFFLDYTSDGLLLLEIDKVSIPFAVVFSISHAYLCYVPDVNWICCWFEDDPILLITIDCILKTSVYYKVYYLGKHAEF